MCVMKEVLADDGDDGVAVKVEYTDFETKETTNLSNVKYRVLQSNGDDEYAVEVKGGEDAEEEEKELEVQLGGEEEDRHKKKKRNAREHKAQWRAAERKSHNRTK